LTGPGSPGRWLLKQRDRVVNLYVGAKMEPSADGCFFYLCAVSFMDYDDHFNVAIFQIYSYK